MWEWRYERQREFVQIKVDVSVLCLMTRFNNFRIYLLCDKIFRCSTLTFVCCSPCRWSIYDFYVFSMPQKVVRAKGKKFMSQNFSFNIFTSALRHRQRRGGWFKMCSDPAESGRRVVWFGSKREKTHLFGRQKPNFCNNWILLMKENWIKICAGEPRARKSRE